MHAASMAARQKPGTTRAATSSADRAYARPRAHRRSELLTGSIVWRTSTMEFARRVTLSTVAGMPSRRTASGSRSSCVNTITWRVRAVSASTRASPSTRRDPSTAPDRRSQMNRNGLSGSVARGRNRLAPARAARPGSSRRGLRRGCRPPSPSARRAAARRCLRARCRRDRRCSAGAAVSRPPWRDRRSARSARRERRARVLPPRPRRP